jgi:hypothetical protein
MQITEIADASSAAIVMEKRNALTIGPSASHLRHRLRRVEVSKQETEERRSTSSGRNHTINVSVVLTGEQAAAVEGWRVANQIHSQSDAVRELVRIGLLAEIGRIYRMISGGTTPDNLADLADRTG